MLENVPYTFINVKINFRKLAQNKNWSIIVNIFCHRNFKTNFSLKIKPNFHQMAPFYFMLRKYQVFAAKTNDVNAVIKMSLCRILKLACKMKTLINA